MVSVVSPRLWAICSIFSPFWHKAHVSERVSEVSEVEPPNVFLASESIREGMFLLWQYWLIVVRRKFPYCANFISPMPGIFFKSSGVRGR